MEHYAKFFSQEWWRSDMQRYGIKELRFPAVRNDGTPLQSVLRAGSESQDAEIIRAFRSRHTVRWMLSTASPLLRRAGHNVVERFLKLATFEAASAKSLRRRLFYDSNSWENKFNRLFKLHDDTCGWFDFLSRNVAGRLDRQYSFQAVSPDEITRLLDNEYRVLTDTARDFLGILKETVRGVAQESAYVDHIVQLFLRQSPSSQMRIWNRYLVHLAA